MNKVFLSGNVGVDPEIRTFDNGDKAANFTLATTTRWKNKEGEKKSRTEWHRCVAFRGLAKVVESYVEKGSALVITGEVRYRKYERDGDTKYVTEIYIDNLELGARAKSSENPETGAPKDEDGNETNFNEDDDDLPF